MFDALLSNKVPELWMTAGYPSLKPLASWYRDLEVRTAPGEYHIRVHPRSRVLCFRLFVATGPNGFHARLEQEWSSNLDLPPFHFLHAGLPHGRAAEARTEAPHSGETRSSMSKRS